MYEEEKIEFANQKVNEMSKDMARAMLNEGIDLVKTMKITGLTEDEFYAFKIPL